MSYGDPTTTNAHTWVLDDDDAQLFFREAVEMGVTFRRGGTRPENG